MHSILAAAAAGIVAAFVGNAVFLQPSDAVPSLRLRFDSGGYDLIAAQAAARERLQSGTVELRNAPRRIYRPPTPTALADDALLEARPGNLESIFVEPVDGTLSLGRFVAQPITLNFPKKTVTLGAAPLGGDRIALSVARGPKPAPELVETVLATLPVTIDGRPVTMLLDTGADVGIPPALRGRFDDAAASRSLPLISSKLFARLHARHPNWPVLTAAARMAETKKPVSLLRVPEFRIGTHRGPPTWFAVREDGSTYAALTRMLRTPVEGDLGGEALRAWRVTIDVAGETLTID